MFTLFLIALVAESILITTSMALERVSIAFISFIALLVAVHFGVVGWQLDMVQFLLSDLTRTLTIFSGYLLIGALYSRTRWHFRVNHVAPLLKAAREAANAKIEERVQESRRNPEDRGHPGFFNEEQCRRGLVNDNARELSTLRNKLNPRRNKALITGWISFWPFDILVFLFKDPAIRIFNFLYNTYLNSSNSALIKHGLGDDLKKMNGEL